MFNRKRVFFHRLRNKKLAIFCSAKDTILTLQKSHSQILTLQKSDIYCSTYPTCPGCTENYIGKLDGLLLTAKFWQFLNTKSPPKSHSLCS